MIEMIPAYVIPVVSIGLTYVFGRMHTLQSDKKAAYKEAYDSFYLPFISLLYETQIWDTGFSRLSFKDRHRLFEIVSRSIKYMDKAILEYVDVLYTHYSAILGKELFDADSLFTHDRADEIFNELVLKTLSRATWLARKLHQPRLGEFVRELYLEETITREKRQAKAAQYDGHKR